MRRGLATSGEAAANAGVIESSIGKASSTPVPARKRRRETERLKATYGAFVEEILGEMDMGLGLLIKEKIAGDKPLNQIAHAVVRRNIGIEYSLELSPVSEPNGRARGVNSELTE